MIKTQVELKFRHALNDTELLLIESRNYSIIRNICYKLGIQLNKSFNPMDITKSDVLNIYPILKSTNPNPTFALDVMLHAKQTLATDSAAALELFFEGSAINEAVFGIVSEQNARYYSTLSMLFFEIGKFEEARQFMDAAIIVFERVLCADHAETLAAVVCLY